jgi:hypothetical protein
MDLGQVTLSVAASHRFQRVLINREVLASRRRVLGDTHQRTLSSMASLGKVLARHPDAGDLPLMIVSPTPRKFWFFCVRPESISHLVDWRRLRHTNTTTPPPQEKHDEDEEKQQTG